MIPLPVLAETGEGATRVLAIFAGIALVGIAATFATTRFYARLQRHRWVAAFTAGGWFAMITGIVIGPRVLAVLDAEGTQALQPLLYIALAWIGLIVGLQLRRPLLAAIPAELARWIRLDTIVSLLVGTAVAIGWWRIMAPEAAFGTILLPALALAVAFIGWAPETRSLRPDLTPRSGELAQLVQAGGGLGAAIAVLIFGLGNQFVRIDPDGPIVIEPWLGLVELFLSAGVAIMLGTGARLLLRRTSGAAQAYSTFSIPRLSSPMASSMVLPCSALIISAMAFSFSSSNCLKRNMICARLAAGVRRQAGKAALAESMACWMTDSSASGT